MKNFLNNRMTVFIVILAVGSISGVGTIQFVRGLDGSGNINGSVIGCVYGACKDTTIGGTLGGGGGQPTPNTGTLTVIKKVDCSPEPACVGVTPETFTIKVTGNNPSDDSFPGNAAGTTITLGPGDYKVSETSAISGFTPTFSGACVKTGNLEASGTMIAGETQECTITNKPG